MHSNTSINSSTLTFILAGGQGKRLAPFTAGRAKPLVPFGGPFRIVDFTLSNCVHSGIDQAFLLTQYKSESIKRYIDSSSWTTQFTCLPSRPSCGYQGTADSIYQNLHLLQAHQTDYVLILAADHIYKMDYRKLIQFHASHGGDVTVAAVQQPRKLAQELGVLEVDDEGQVISFEEKPRHLKIQPINPAAPSTVLASMGVYVFNAASLRQALLRDAGNFNGSHEFGGDILPSMVRTRRVFAYNFNQHSGAMGSYWRDVGTVDSYHRAHMELLLLNSAFDPFNDARWPVYAGGREVSFHGTTIGSPWIRDSIVSPDSVVGGAMILQSVVSPAVQVAPTAHVQGSILMSNVRIGAEAQIRHAIIDEGVEILAGEKIGCDLELDRRRFLVTDNGVTVVHGGHSGAFRTRRPAALFGSHVQPV